METIEIAGSLGRRSNLQRRSGRCRGQGCRCNCSRELDRRRLPPPACSDSPSPRPPLCPKPNYPSAGEGFVDSRINWQVWFDGEREEKCPGTWGVSKGEGSMGTLLSGRGRRALICWPNPQNLLSWLGPEGKEGREGRKGQPCICYSTYNLLKRWALPMLDFILKRKYYISSHKI